MRGAIRAMLVFASALNVAAQLVDTPAALLPGTMERATDRLGVIFAPPADVPAPAPAADAEPAIVLPKFEVLDSRLRLSERDVLTSKELIARAKARYTSPVYQATFGQLSAALGMITNWNTIFSGWHPNDAEAAVLFAQDERLRQMKESKELIDLFKDTDPKAYRELQNSLTSTFRHSPPPSTRRGE